MDRSVAYDRRDERRRMRRKGRRERERERASLARVPRLFDMI